MTRCAAADSPAMPGGSGRQAEQQKGGQISNTVLDDRWYSQPGCPVGHVQTRSRHVAATTLTSMNYTERKESHETT